MRRDIQFLRGIAVLVVVLYHSNLGFLNQGYLGVDVFFVLSGFLITTIILKSLEEHSFSFFEFYLRRAKRLLPALYSTLFFTTLLCLIVLTNQQWLEYLDQLTGALTFTANMVLPSQSGYFESASEGKPLLHIWSLSLEEQYYFLLPISLYFLPKAYRLSGLLVLFTVSLLWCFSWVYGQEQSVPFLWRIADSPKSEWAFYFLFTRAWELLAGSLCAWVMLNKANVTVPRVMKFFALILIFLTCIININNEHPSFESVIVVAATMIILLGNKEWLPNNYFCRCIEKLGDWSYSVYLVHWPLFAFAYLTYVGDVPTWVKATLIVSSILLGFLQYTYVETPFRTGKFKNVFSNWRLSFVATLMLLAIPVTSAYTSSDNDSEFSHIRRHNFGFGKVCEGSFDLQGDLKEACITGNQPKIAVWGDSYAMHLVPGLSSSNNNLAQLTKSVCGPIKGLAPIIGKYDYNWAQSCLAFNDNAMRYISAHRSITHVVMSANFSNYLNMDKVEYLTEEGVVKSDYQQFITSFKNTIDELKQLGITPVVISPPPKAGFDVGECLERQHGTTLLLRQSCNIDFNAAQQYQAAVNHMLSDIEQVTRVIWLSDYLCDSFSCITYIDGTFIYRDSGHLSVDGSLRLLKDKLKTN